MTLDALPPISAAVAGYVRVAAVPQSNPSSGFVTEAATIRAFAEAAGVKLARFFEDAGESAHNAWRPGRVALLAAVEAGGTMVIVVTDLTRLACDPVDLHRLLDLFARRGVGLISVTEPWGF
jgi:DNA invertase Pin-like site-specific DNA recombinase